MHISDRVSGGEGKSLLPLPFICVSRVNSFILYLQFVKDANEIMQILFADQTQFEQISADDPQVCKLFHLTSFSSFVVSHWDVLGLHSLLELLLFKNLFDGMSCKFDFRFSIILLMRLILHLFKIL